MRLGPPSYDRGVRWRSQLLGPDARPVSLPGPDCDRSKTLPGGKVVSPSHIRWSEPSVTYDLDDPADLLRVDEQVMREGAVEDIQEYIDAERVVELWEELVLPTGVRRRSLEKLCWHTR